MGTLVKIVFVCLLSWDFFANGMHLVLDFGDDANFGYSGSFPNKVKNTPTASEYVGTQTGQSPPNRNNVAEQDPSYNSNNTALQQESIAYTPDTTDEIAPQGSCYKGNGDDDNGIEITLTVSPSDPREEPAVSPQYDSTQNCDSPTGRNIESGPQQSQEDSNYTSPEESQGLNISSNNAASNDAQSKLELKQVTVSQILYHMNVEYEKMYKKEGNNAQTTEILETFLSKMLRVSETSETTTVEGDKNIASTTYAAYYSTEYTYTFALCKLHHLTGGSKNGQNKMNISQNISSQCAEVVEKFSTFSTLYERVVSTASNKNQVLENNDNAIDNNDDKTFTSNNEVIEKSNNEKALRGYNKDKFISRSRAETQNSDKYDVQSKQKAGNSVYSAQTVGARKNFASVMDSDIMVIPKNGIQGNLEKSLRKIRNAVQTTDESNTKERIENDQSIIDNNRSTKYSKSQEELDEFARNYGEDDNKDIGGNIPNAEFQDEEKHYSTTVEKIQEVNEQVRKPKPPASSEPTHTFHQTVQTLISYIRTVQVFVSNMEKNVEDKKNSAANGQDTDIYTEMYTSVHEETKIQRIYLRNYFAKNVNVAKGTFSGNTEVDMQTETNMVETTVDRYSWLKKSSEIQKQTNARGELESNPLELLWYFEEAGFYLEYVKTESTDVSFMSYLPYPDFEVIVNLDDENGVDIVFYIN